MRSVRSSLPLFFLLATVGGCDCQKQQLVATLPPDVRIDTYSQQAANKIDVLWVVDNSGSMEPRQNNLANNFQAFMTEFTRNDIDYRIAVTTTDIFKEAGAFVGAPSILSPTTPSVINAFANNIKVGSNGSPYEVGMDAARLALEGQKARNDAKVAQCKSSCPNDNRAACETSCEVNSQFDFLRTDAYLYLIFVSDEEDRSSEDVRFFYRYFETVKGVGNDGMVTTAAIMGDVPSNTCGATPGQRYQDLSNLTGGEVGSICDENFSETLKKLANNAVGLKRKFLLQDAPNLQTLQVRIKYPCNISADWTSVCASVDRSACDGAPADSMNVICTPRQGAPDGWVYEAGGNLVYFEGDSVPGLSGLVELQYYEEGKGPK